MFGGLGLQEILIIAGIGILIFGPRQLPKLGRALGETIREFRGIGRELTDAKDRINDDLRDVDRNVRRG